MENIGAMVAKTCDLDAISSCASLAFFAKNRGLKDFECGDATRKFQSQNIKTKVKNLVVFVCLGAIVGAINGLFGAGGGMLAVPVLSFAGKLNDKKAHATAILVMLPLCLTSMVVYAANGALNFEVLIPTSIGVFVGGVLGAKLMKYLPTTLLFFVFYALMLMAGLNMIF